MDKPKPTPDNSFLKNICGVRGPPSKVVGGTTAKRLEYTWMALLTKTTGTVRTQVNIDDVRALLETHRPFCGGSLVTGHWIVTAGHCTTGDTVPGKYIVVLGEWDRDLDFDTFITIHKVWVRYALKIVLFLDVLLILPHFRLWKEFSILSMTPRVTRMISPSGD